MTAYRYKAISGTGEEVTGVVEAGDEFEAVAKIKETCEVVTEITAVPIWEQKNPFGTHAVREKALALLCSQFHILLGAGLPMVRTLELIASQTADRSLKKLLLSTVQDVAAGYGLAESLENKSKSFPVTFIETIRAGEESGTLEKSFEKLSLYYDKAAKVKGKVMSALAYPVLLTLTAVGTVAVIMVVAVPMFTSMFASLQVELPLPTRILIGLSAFLKHFGLYLLAFLVALVVFFRFWFKTERGKLASARLQLKLPLLGKVTLMQSSAQFSHTLSTLLTAGLPLVRAVTVTGHVLSNYMLGLQVTGTVPGLEEGKNLGACLAAANCLPSMLVEMTAVGEESGSLESTLEIIGTYYDSETDQLTGRILSLLEPIITLIMALLVMFILLSLYLPMFSMYSNL